MVEKSFHFKGCVEIKELLGKKATDELGLLNLIKKVPDDSIYYHTHSYFLRHFYLAGQYPNDFADWAVLQLRDRVLGEKLGVVTPSGSKSIEDIRSELAGIISAHLSSLKNIPAITYGQPFYFMKSIVVEIPTNVYANNFSEFIEAVKTIEASAIYNHIFEARFRAKKGKSDFSVWLSEKLGLKDLAEKIENIDCYMYSLEGLRTKIIHLCEKEKISEKG